MLARRVPAPPRASPRDSDSRLRAPGAECSSSIAPPLNPQRKEPAPCPALPRTRRRPSVIGNTRRRDVPQSLRSHPSYSSAGLSCRRVGAQAARGAGGGIVWVGGYRRGRSEMAWQSSVSRQPMAENCTRCWPLYEARDARISILARSTFRGTGYVNADCSAESTRRRGPYVFARAEPPRPPVRAVDRGSSWNLAVPVSASKIADPGLAAFGGCAGQR